MKSHRILLAILMVVLLIPGLLVVVPSLRGEDLFGVQKVDLREKSAMSLLLDKKDEIEDFAKQHVGFCNYGVRFYNELNYRIFNYSSAPKLILGKKDNFYENIYINEYMGQDFVGEDAIRKNVQLLKRMQDSLDKRGKKLLVVLEPGKVRFMPENLPMGCSKGIQTNYDTYLFYCQKYGVEFLNLNRYFCENKERVAYPLYSRHGIHWTTYGMWLAADTLQHFIERECRVRLPQIKHVGDSISDKNSDLDFDLEPPMNLWMKLKHEKLCFPMMEFSKESCPKLKLFLVADSYAWSLWDKGVFAHWFDEPEFWYYNNLVYPNIWGPNAVYANKNNLPQIVEEKDVILIMITDANLKNFSWGFLNELSKILR